MRIASLVCAVALAAGMMVHQAAACGLSRFFGGPAATTTYYAGYAPYSVAYQPSVCTACYPSSCAVGCAAPVGVYRARTYYRAAYPTVAAQPAVACAACSGVAVTTYRPAFTWPWRVGFAPHVTRRVVYANPCPLPGAGVPALSSPVGTLSAGCGCAPATGGSTTTYYTPPAQTVVPEPPTEGTAEQGTTAPQEQKTFEQESDQQQSEPQEQIDLRPIPEGGPIPETGSPTGVSPLPRLLEPQGPTASRSVRYTAHQLAPVRSADTRVLDDDGWRPSHE